MTDFWPDDLTLAVFDEERIKALIDKLPDGSIQLNFSKEHIMPARDKIGSSGLDHHEFEYTVNLYTDGTRTEAVVSSELSADPDGHIASGVAQRRKGEKPKPQAATALALGRAFRDLAEGYFKLARINGLPEAKR